MGADAGKPGLHGWQLKSFPSGQMFESLFMAVYKLIQLL
tara:strand:- start:64479 stop:64595 length:117 start_codon:yes stop_codon:yes gene_type:complete